MESYNRHTKMMPEELMIIRSNLVTGNTFIRTRCEVETFHVLIGLWASSIYLTVCALNRAPSALTRAMLWSLPLNSGDFRQHICWLLADMNLVK